MNEKHGLREHPLYTVWGSMKHRCYYEKHKSYKYYGARGITICDEWKNNFQSFYNWALSNGWANGLDIDRINTDGNYGPDNCRFVTRKENCNNRRNTILITYNGLTKTILEWCKLKKINFDLFKSRLRMGWDVNEIFSTPSKKGFITHNGQTKRLSEWSKLSGVKESTICMRINKYGWPTSKALNFLQ